MRAFIAAVLAVLLLAVPASAAPRLRVSAPSSAKAGTKVTVKLTGPKTGKVRVYVLTRTSVRKADKPLARGNLKRGKVTLHVKVPAKARTYRLVACLEGSKLKCATAKKLKAVAVAAAVKPPVVTPPGATPSTPVVELPGRPAANPWSVTLAPERGRTQSARIGPAGGTLAATGSDGTAFRLTLPPGALAGPETVSLTPAGAVAVLEPAGLGLARPAVVSIAYGADPLAFTAHDDGTEAHLVPQTFDDAGAVQVALRRFVPVGATAGPLEDWAAHAPTGEADVAQHQIAVAQARWARGLMTADVRDTAVASALKRWRSLSVAPALAGSDFEAATMDFLAWQDAGGSDASLTAAHAAQLAASADAASAACHAGAWTSMGRLLLLAHLDRQLDYGLGVDGERLERCGRFTVERTVDFQYRSDATATASATGIAYATRAVGSIAYATGDPELHAAAPTTETSWNVSGAFKDPAGECDHHWETVTDPPAPGVTSVVLDLPVNLGVPRAPVLRMVGAQSLLLPYDDVFPDDGFCPPRRRVTEPTTPGADALALDGDLHGTTRSLVTDALSSTTIDTTVTLVHTPG